MVSPMKLLRAPIVKETCPVSIIIHCFPCLQFWLEGETEAMGGGVAFPDMQQ